MGWTEAMEEAKKGHRPRLKNWARDHFATDRLSDFEGLASKVYKDEAGSTRCRIARESAAQLTPEAFVERYEKKKIPVVISGVPDEARWAACRRWT
jgi:hypothetical protein